MAAKKKKKPHHDNVLGPKPLVPHAYVNEIGTLRGIQAVGCLCYQSVEMLTVVTRRTRPHDSCS